ncbi:hypothetical protein MANES_09G137000v8 [Manihot esculenta]|uniref:Uncharacterized protein n=1 Tax=Manihot esculenta TaxID=3983 RepID=A0ACB7H5Z8_MANES|nr:hypothetical protein MANES_09G137000v8 [Manihot esculenta]
MGFIADSQKGVGLWGGCVRSLVRRKQVDSAHVKVKGHHQLAKELSVPHLIVIGIGSTIGAGVYILVGTVAREHSGPALAISFLIAGVAAALSAFCYAELASRCPSAGSAYHYSYICIGEGVAWLIGWALVLEYTIGGSAVARGISPNLAFFFGGPNSLPGFLARQHIPGLDIVVDPVASILVFIVTGLLCVGIKEVKNPQRDLPLGIGFTLATCCTLYMLVSVVILGLVPYYAMNPDTPISSVFAEHGVHWAAYIITSGAVMALCSALMGSLLPQPRILMAMARDGLLPSFFSDVNKNTQVPVKSTLATGIGAATLAFFMDVDQLAGMVSVGTLLAFTMVAISVLILRYVPPDEVPFPSSLQDTIDSVALQYDLNGQDINCETSEIDAGTSSTLPMLHKNNAAVDYPEIVQQEAQVVLKEENRRKIAGWTIAFTCTGAFLLTYAATDLNLPRPVRFTMCGVGGALLLFGLIVLTLVEQDDARHSFGHSGGFICPFVPLLPIFCILINTYLLINLGAATWARVSVWLLIGVFVYALYGRTHSSLLDAVYVPVAHADRIHRSSVDILA